MKQPTAPAIYPELPSEDGQNYCLQKISEIEKKLIRERERERCKKGIIQKYRRRINVTDGVDTALICTSVIMAGLGLIVSVMDRYPNKNFRFFLMSWTDVMM